MPPHTSEKPVDVTDSTDLKTKVPDVQVFGNPDAWELIAKAWSKSQRWMKSTKALEVTGLGVIVQVTTEVRDSTGAVSVAEALTFVPGATIVARHENVDGVLTVTREIVVASAHEKTPRVPA